jgi:hypothetical protein
MPLPTFADGTQATIEECRYLVSARNNPGSAEVWTDGLTGYVGNASPPTTLTYNFIIIASRQVSGTPTATAPTSWGGIKAAFR